MQKRAITSESTKSELAQLRDLLILLLVKLGTPSQEIALATGTGSSTIRKEFPAKKIRRFSPTSAREVEAE
jgi:hypothetical protein